MQKTELHRMKVHVFNDEQERLHALDEGKIAHTDVSITPDTDGEFLGALYTLAQDNSYMNHIADAASHVSQSDRSAWNAKQDHLVAGEGIEIAGNTISALGALPHANPFIKTVTGTNVEVTDAQKEPALQAVLFTGNP